MEVKLRFRRVGDSIMLTIPVEALVESGFHEGQEVLVRARHRQIDSVPDDAPTPDVVAFADRFEDQYRQALKRLAGS